MAKKKRTEEQEKLAGAIEAARQGNLPWLDEIIKETGYIHPEEGIQQRDLTLSSGVDPKVLLSWERDGLESTTRKRRKYYPIGKLVRYLVETLKKRGTGPSTGKSKEYDAMERKYKALDRKAVHEKKMGLLISKEDSDHKFRELIIHIVAGMETAFGGLAPQLVGLSVQEVRNQLERRITWLCVEMQKGRTPVPSKAAGEAVRKVIKDHLG